MEGLGGRLGRNRINQVSLTAPRRGHLPPFLDPSSCSAPETGHPRPERADNTIRHSLLTSTSTPVLDTRNVPERSGTLVCRDLSAFGAQVADPNDALPGPALGVSDFRVSGFGFGVASFEYAHPDGALPLTGLLGYRVWCLGFGV